MIYSTITDYMAGKQTKEELFCDFRSFDWRS
jgi:hypothetical protein